MQIYSSVDINFYLCYKHVVIHIFLLIGAKNAKRASFKMLLSDFIIILLHCGERQTPLHAQPPLLIQINGHRYVCKSRLFRSRRLVPFRDFRSVNHTYPIGWVWTPERTGTTERNDKFAFRFLSKIDEIRNGTALFLATNHNLPLWPAVQSQTVPAFLSVPYFIPTGYPNSMNKQYSSGSALKLSHAP